VPLSNMLLGEGRGFEIAQGRLGPGRLHHCMRLIGMGEVAMELMGRRALQRVAFGKPIAQHGSFAADFARCRVELAAARLTVLDAADALDRHGNKRVGRSFFCLCTSLSLLHNLSQLFFDSTELKCETSNKSEGEGRGLERSMRYFQCCKHKRADRLLLLNAEKSQQN
jgi:hypothetical protein